MVIGSDGEEEDLKTLAGRHCSSYRAEMLVLASGLEHLLDNPRDRDAPIVICTNSMASLATLRAGPTARLRGCLGKDATRSTLNGCHRTAGSKATSGQTP